GRALFRVEPKAHGAGHALDFAQLLLHNPDGWGEQRDVISVSQRFVSASHGKDGKTDRKSGSTNKQNNIPLQGSPWRTPTDQRAVTWVPLAPLTTIVASLYKFWIKLPIALQQRKQQLVRHCAKGVGDV
ncbi:conserved hypothetical protein, partial [Trichinella spiralis]